MDEGMLDFLAAADAANRTSIPNLSTIPNWLFTSTDRTYVPDDPLQIVYDYESASTELVDPTAKAVGDYYGRLVAHYIEGGFLDEAGRWIPGFNLTFSHWEVLNEVNAEHRMTPQTYTTIYDAVVAGIKRWAPRGSASMKFMGIGGAGPGYIPYFLNKSNHALGSDTQIDLISLHWYAGSKSRDGGNETPGGDYVAFFPSADGFVEQLSSAYAAIATSDFPHVMIDADEVGVILPDDDDPKWVADTPGFPALFWNAAAAYFAYLFGETAKIGLDVLGASQLTGYPSLTFPRGPPINGPFTAACINPSVSLLSWGGDFGDPGDGTARYWVLALLLEEFRASGPAGLLPASDADVLVATATAGGNEVSSPFCADQPNLSLLKMYCETGVIDAVLFADYGTALGDCGAWVVNASCTAPTAEAVVRALCVGKAACSIPTDTPTFGDPCFGVSKHLVLNATCSVGGGSQVRPPAVYAQAFVERAGAGARKILVVNTEPRPHDVTFAGAAGGAWHYIDESSGYGPAAKTTLASDTWTLAPFSLGVLRPA